MTHRNHTSQAQSYQDAGPLYLTRKQFCFLANIGLTKLYEERRAGRIKDLHIGLRGVRIHRDELTNWPKRCRGERIPGEE